MNSLFQRDQLEEGMFFLLASLPKDSFKVMEEIFKKYESGSLVKLTKAKLNSKMGKGDCKYSLRSNIHCT